MEARGSGSLQQNICLHGSRSGNRRAWRRPEMGMSNLQRPVSADLLPTARPHFLGVLATVSKTSPSSIRIRNLHRAFQIQIITEPTRSRRKSRKPSMV